MRWERSEAYQTLSLFRVEELTGHAFLSYVREDSDEVDKLQRMLEAAGVSVWRDTADLWPGEDWRVKIRHAITDNALVFIACFSGKSIARKKTYQNEEILLAIEQLRLRRPDDPWLIPVRFDDCDVPDLEIGGGRTLASIQRVDMFGDRRDPGIARLVAAVLHILEQHSYSTISDQLAQTKVKEHLLSPGTDQKPDGQTYTSPAETPYSEPVREGITASADPGATSFRHLGIVLTVISVTCSYNVRLNNSGFRTGSGRETYEDAAAGDEAKFVSVKLRVLNDSKKGLDLTCGYPIKNYLIDERNREFTTIGKLYRIPGNPECNAKLQPGFSGDMTYIYRVPLDTNISAFMFEDATDLNRDRRIKATRIPLTVPAPRACL